MIIEIIIGAIAGNIIGLILGRILLKAYDNYKWKKFNTRLLNMMKVNFNREFGKFKE